MKTLIALNTVILLGLSILSAHAADPVSAFQTHNEFHFTVSSMGDDGSEVYYNAGALESRTASILRQLGATNIYVRIPGSPNELILNPYVYVQFDSMRMQGASSDVQRSADWKPIHLRANSSDGTATQGVFDGVKSHFELKDLKESSQGWGQTYSFDAQMSALVSE